MSIKTQTIEIFSDVNPLDVQMFTVPVRKGQKIYCHEPYALEAMKMYDKFCGDDIIGGIMSSTSSSLRGIGYSTVPMVVSVFGTCVLRVIWIFTIFASWHTLRVLYSCYPVTWFITAILQGTMFLVLWKRLRFEVNV